VGSNIACKPISLKNGYFELMWQQGDTAEVMPYRSAWLTRHRQSRLHAEIDLGYMNPALPANRQLRTANCESLWGGRRDSNPQQLEPQSRALPLSYDHRFPREV